MLWDEGGVRQREGVISAPPLSLQKDFSCGKEGGEILSRVRMSPLSEALFSPPLKKSPSDRRWARCSCLCDNKVPLLPQEVPARVFSLSVNPPPPFFFFHQEFFISCRAATCTFPLFLIDGPLSPRHSKIDSQCGTGWFSPRRGGIPFPGLELLFCRNDRPLLLPHGGLCGNKKT